MMKSALLRAAMALTLVLLPATSPAALVISYAVTDGSIADGTASGTILDGGQQIGLWSVTGFAFTQRNLAVTFTPSIGTVTEATTDNSYGKAGIGIRVIGNGSAADGVMSMQYTVSYSLDAGYAMDSVSFWGKYPNTVGAYGPAEPINGGGSLSVAGFTGLGVVSDPTDNLNVADGYLFSSGENLGGWKTGNTAGGDWSAASVGWQFTVPTAQSLTFVLDYSDQNLSAANEASAFNFNITSATPVPEPGTWLTGFLLVAGAALWHRRRRTA
jgi:MYXO-CTERM domain-containing protein